MKPVIIAGPCVIESSEVLDEVARKLVRLNETYDLDIIFKASFDKANRTSVSSFRGPGIDKGLEMLDEVKKRYKLRILTDIQECPLRKNRFHHKVSDIRTLNKEYHDNPYICC